MFLYVKETIKE